MKYIKKSRSRNQIKEVIDITEFKAKDFEDFELYSVQEISPHEFGDILRDRKAKALISELNDLGIDLAKYFGGEPKVDDDSTEFNTDDALKRALQEDNVQKKGNIIPETNEGLVTPDGIMSNITKPDKSGKYTMEEIKNVYFQFKEKVEADIEELSFGNYDENGITLTMIEIRPDLPKMLSNGIPVRQVLQ